MAVMIGKLNMISKVASSPASLCTIISNEVFPIAKHNTMVVLV